MEFPKFSFRIAPEVATRLEEEASNRELTTSELVREIVTTHYEKSAAPETSGTESVASADPERRFRQLVFEIGKTRSALLQFGLRTVPEETMEQILAAATDDAKDYAVRVAAGMKGSRPSQETKTVRAGAETAIRWRAGVTSFHMALQMAARSMLAGVTIWALSTFLLVCFWVRHYLPPRAAVLQALVVLVALRGGDSAPLPERSVQRPALSDPESLPLPERQDLLPLLSDLVLALCKLGTIPALLALAVAAYVFAPAAAGGEAEHIRGVTIISARRLGWQLRGDGLELGGVRLPRALETQHIAVTGKSEAGKSNLIRGVLRQIAARREVGVVLDPDREYLSEFYRPERGDVVLNPLDERCPRWTPRLELRPGYAEPDAEAQAESLFPDPPPQADVGSTPFFRRSSRMFYLSLLKIAEPREPAALIELLNLPRAELKRRLKGTPAEALIDPGAHEQGAGIVATVANAVNPFRYLPRAAAPEWSAREWGETRAGWSS